MKLTRAFTAINFESSFLFEDGRTRNGIYKDLKKDFQLVELKDDSKTVAFYNPKNKIKCVIQNNLISVDIEDPDNMDMLKSWGNSIIPSIMRKLEVSSTERVGVRALFINNNEQDMFKSSLLISNNYFSNDLISLIEQHDNEGIDVSPKIGFTIKINQELSMNVNIGQEVYMKAKGHLVPNGEMKITDIQSKFPVYDLDVYTMVSKTDDKINGILKGCCNNIETYLHKVLKGVTV